MGLDREKKKSYFPSATNIFITTITKWLVQNGNANKHNINYSGPPQSQDRTEVEGKNTEDCSPFCSFQVIICLLKFSNVFLKLIFNSFCLCQVIFQCRDLPVPFWMLYFNLFLYKDKSNSASETWHCLKAFKDRHKSCEIFWGTSAYIQ